MTRARLTALFITAVLAARGEPERSVLKADRWGAIEVPRGMTVLSLRHQDPYRRDAELAFAGSVDDALAAVATELEAVNFYYPDQFKSSPHSMCRSGVIAPDGTGTCDAIMSMEAGGGTVALSFSKPTVDGPGRLKMTREFLHRMPNDPVGPPYSNRET